MRFRKFNSISDQIVQSITSFLIVFLAHIKLSSDDFIFIGILTTIQFNLSGVLRSLIIERAYVLIGESFKVENALRRMFRPMLYFYVIFLFIGVYLYLHETFFAANICFGTLGLCACIMFEMRRGLHYILNQNNFYYLEYIPIAIFPPILVTFLKDMALIQYMAILYGPYLFIEIMHSFKTKGMSPHSEVIVFRKFIRNGSSLGLATIINLLSNLLFIKITILAVGLLYTDIRLAQNFCSPLGFLQKVLNLKVFEKKILKKEESIKTKVPKYPKIVRAFIAVLASYALLKLFYFSNPNLNVRNLYPVYLIIFTEVLAVMLTKYSSLIRLEYPKIALLNSISILMLSLAVLTTQLLTNTVFIVHFLCLKVFIYLLLNNDVTFGKLHHSFVKKP
jgi:hypothetical protein